jgi:hypothetical protein
MRRTLATLLAAAALAGAGTATAAPADARGWTSVRSVTQSTAAVLVMMKDGTTQRLVPGGTTLHYRSEPRVVQIDSHACVKVSTDGRPWRQLRATTRQWTPPEDRSTRVKVWRCR